MQWSVNSKNSKGIWCNMEQDKNRNRIKASDNFWTGIIIAGTGVVMQFGLAGLVIYCGLVMAALSYASAVWDWVDNKTLSKGDGQG